MKPIRPEWVELLKKVSPCIKIEEGLDWSAFPKEHLVWALFNVPGQTQEQRDEIGAECGCTLYCDEDDLRHREDGPAMTLADGYEAWYFHGKRHRMGGPAVTRADGTTEYWINGIQVK